ncbi:hypothetical protein ACQ4M3_20480 [Leptolyngbya sp. AN03gr2]|uniref:hypothetical protein n=1 Tax=unclassified Leptolyngbya TaxID=2650499 RepID=UPI003D315CD1
MTPIEQGMSEIVLVQTISPQNQLRDFFNRGMAQFTTTANQAAKRLQGRTYLEWYLHFEEQNFQPILREAPIMERVLLALYEGMIIEAEEAAQHWTTLPNSEREWYRRMALLFADREPTPYTVRDRIWLTLESILMVHNFGVAQ